MRPLLAALLVIFAAASIGIRAAGPPVSIVAAVDPNVTVIPGTPSLIGVLVTDAAGVGVPNPVVQWQGPASGPHALITTFPSGFESEGYSAVSLEAVGGQGTYQVTASMAGIGSVVFQVTNVQGEVQTLTAVGGRNQSTVINTAFAEPIVIVAADAGGAPVSGALITFAPAASGPSATLPATTATTGADGRVSMPASANAIAGVHVLHASVSTSTATRSTDVRLSNLASAPATLQYLEGDNQPVTVGGAEVRLGVRVLNASGVAMPNVAVDFAGPTSGAGLAYVFDPNDEDTPQFPGGGRVLTDFQGKARPSVAANSAFGPYLVSASVRGIAGSVTFALTNVPRTVGAILPNGAPQDEYDGEDTGVGARFDSIAFQVVDVDGVPIAGIAVTLTPPTTGASVVLDQPVVVTDDEGFARTAGTANNIAGSYYLQAMAAGFADPAFMYMQNRPPGFAIGEHIANVSAFDHSGTLRSLASLLGGDNFLLLDVCAAWCTVCRQVQPDGQVARNQLASMGVPIAFVPVLAQSMIPGQPSTAADAISWRTQYQISDPVLHVSGDLQSQLSQASSYILGASRPAFPTYLLVAPDGTIVDRHEGGMLSGELIDFVLDHAPSDLSISNVTVGEGGTATLTVTRARANAPASVSYATAPGTATASDFSSRSGVLQFGNEQLTATIVVPTIDDSIDEPTEQFTVALSNASGATIAQGQATVTVTDNDPAPVVSIDDQRFSEGSSGGVTSAKAEVRLDRASASSVSVSYSMLAGSAKSTDVTLTSGKITFTPGQTSQFIALSIVGDKIVEGKETFTIRLAGPDAATVVDSEAIISIVDDDADTVPPVIETKSDVVVEVKMSASSSVIVTYSAPSAIDKIDGAVAVACVAPSGEKLAYGTHAVNCAAEDKAGNLAVRTFNIIVRLPTVPGAVFSPHDRTAPLSEVHRGERVLVHVNAGAFAARAKVDLAFIDAKGRRHELSRGKAGADGSLDEIVEIPHGAARGAGQVAAESSGATAEYDRAWFVTVLKKPRH